MAMQEMFPLLHLSTSSKYQKALHITEKFAITVDNVNLLCSEGSFDIKSLFVNKEEAKIGSFIKYNNGQIGRINNLKGIVNKKMQLTIQVSVEEYSLCEPADMVSKVSPLKRSTIVGVQCVDFCIRVTSNNVYNKAFDNLL